MTPVSTYAVPGLADVMQEEVEKTQEPKNQEECCQFWPLTSKAMLQ